MVGTRGGKKKGKSQKKKAPTITQEEEPTSPQLNNNNFKPKFVRIVTQNPNFLDRVEHVPGSRRNGKNPLFATSASQTHVSHIHFFYTLLLLLLHLWLNTHRKFQVGKVCLRPSQTPSFQRPNHDRTRFFVR
jgi:hypothetical protein